ncbi:DUF2599 domain-containing protein [Arsenicicoccus dermatophilus]|uniref:DUF2599 domain-containing protein n=1 Tax=Arsenicicoccus dermatophilus TaxID=1076331 RepID=UPI0039172776
MARGTPVRQGAALGAMVLVIVACQASPAPEASGTAPIGRTEHASPTAPRGALSTGTSTNARCAPVGGIGDPAPATTVLPRGRDRWILLRGATFVRGVRVTPAHARLEVADGQVCSRTSGVRVVERVERPVAATRWITRGSARSLAVTPTWAGTGWPGAADAVLDDLRRHHQEMGLPGMQDQLRCHVTFAPGKKVWHLEPTRPDVGLPATIATRCNPGAERDPDGR